MMIMNAIGRLTKNIVLKYGDNSGVAYVHFGLAVNTGFGDNKKVTFFDCSIFGADAERLVKAGAKQGSFIQVVGDFSRHEYPREGRDLGVSLRLNILAWSYVSGTANGSGTGNNDVDISGNDVSNDTGNDIRNYNESENGETTPNSCYAQAPPLMDNAAKFDPSIMNLDEDDDLPIY